MIYVIWKSYSGGVNNLSIAKDSETDYFSTSLSSDKQAINNLKRLLKAKRNKKKKELKTS
jgi:hypothetical protein